ncbi:phosphatase PAP2 family protein [Brucepastera parasyntrophica]|uniref:phosphatase PAP2 family protein n=1 Tax=Brucepastera parasyntrophica TaxID=2880008 RepID=UPI00210B513C|nr:phosphatase PAP2 family protein [Brucepastera parasyntrophica]ULQ60710.1 phosphatase PAP2 family protein [Brucepastera parasyntrophica]
MKKTVIICMCIYLFCADAFSDSAFKLSLTKDILLGTAAVGMLVPTFIFDPSPGPAGEKDSINAFDRSMMFSYNKPLDIISTIGAYTALVIPAISVIGNITQLDVLATYGVMYAEAFLLTMATKDLIKLCVARNRPYTYSGEIPAGEENDYYNSFPSGHTAYAFLGATFLTVTFLAEYPESKWRIPLIAGGYTLAASVAAARVLSGNHFVTDVLAGALIGSLYGWLIPFVHRTPEAEKNELAVAPVPGGFSFSISY